MSTLNLMRGKFPLRPVFLACLAAWFSGQAHAVALGAVTNPIFIGKPFLVTVPVGQTEEDLACINTTLHYGDNLVADVNFQLEGQFLRIRSSKVIDEPLITLTVSADCEYPITRTYSLFAEVPAVQETSRSAKRLRAYDQAYDANVAQQANNQNFFGIESNPNTDYIIVQPLPSANSRARAGSSTTQLGNTDSSSGKIGNAAASSNKQASLPRLELDNAELLEKDPHLRLAYELLTAPAADAKARKEAQDRWAASNASLANSEEIQAENAAAMRAAQKQAMDLQVRIQRSEEAIAKLNMQLDRERSGNDTLRTLLYGILGLLLLGMASGVYMFWHITRRRNKGGRSRDEQAWWEQYPATASPAVDAQDSIMPAQAAAANNLTGYVRDLPVPEVAFDSELSSDFSHLDGIKNARAAGDDAAKSGQKRSDSLQDTQQQAEFFAALGQFDKAEKLLRRYISKHPETSPLVYLSLLGLYHRAAERRPYQALRDHYNSVFNAQIPDFEHFKSDPRGLDSYPEVVTRIQQNWGQSDVIAMIAQLLFRSADGTPQEVPPFAPLAYRELLMLYGVALDTCATEEDHSRMQETIAASAMDWIQRDPIPMGLDDNGAGFSDSNTGPSPLADDLWEKDNSRPPEHLDLELDFDPTIQGDFHDLNGPDTIILGEEDAGPTTINMGMHAPAQNRNGNGHSELSLQLDDSGDTIKAGIDALHQRQAQKK